MRPRRSRRSAPDRGVSGITGVSGWGHEHRAAPPLTASQCPLSSAAGLTQRARCLPASVLNDYISVSDRLREPRNILTNAMLDHHRSNKKISADVMPFTCLFMAFRYTSLTSAQQHLPKARCRNLATHPKENCHD